VAATESIPASAARTAMASVRPSTTGVAVPAGATMAAIGSAMTTGLAVAVPLSHSRI
jgi:Na+/H+-dicarboxylate symporter